MTGIASPIEWPAIQGAILQWLKESTGVEVAWAKQPKRPQKSAPAATLNLFSGPRVLHNDHITKTWNEETQLIDRIASGLREFTIQAQVYTDDVTPNKHAINYLARAQAALKMPDFLSILSGGGVAVVTHEQIVNLSSIAGADWQSRASMEVVFRVASNVVAGSLLNIANTSHTLKLENGNDGEPIIVPTPE